MIEPLIETERTIIRLPNEGDEDALLRFVIENREHLAGWEPERNEEYYTPTGCSERVLKLRSDFEDGGAIPLLAWAREERRIVARCNFSNIVRGPLQACHLGYSVNLADQGKGLMFEVVDAAISYVFESVGLHRIMANYIPRNLRSERLLQRLGFQKEGYARSYLLIAGVWEDHILTALIKGDRHGALLPRSPIM
ncbi:MAG TPA: GNAT family N-acetyltransferase [Spirochaetia bacterium]|nr:GNAT family N-acetyltransferase [Spirochaetia bacterium]